MGICRCRFSQHLFTGYSGLWTPSNGERLVILPPFAESGEAGKPFRTESMTLWVMMIGTCRGFRCLQLPVGEIDGVAAGVRGAVREFEWPCVSVGGSRLSDRS